MSVVKTNPVDPEYRKALRDTGDDIQLRPTHGDKDKRPFFLRTDGFVGAGTVRALGDLDLRIVGVTHRGDCTHIHVTEDY